MRRSDAGCAAVAYPRTGHRRWREHMRHSVEVSGPASVALAWERYADPALWSTWAPQIRRVTWRGGDRLAAGLTGVVHAIAGVNVPFEVTAVDAAAHDWSWIVRPLGVTLRMRHT
ncbi:MAG: SRPBCC family protein, partial [Actinobacteria bacterium]|nr:SRPBCC family protein [Actinomycetota bacterium]